MANERVHTLRNAGTEETPVWEKWFAVTVADAVLMSDRDGETKTIVDYVAEKFSELVGGAPEMYDTLKEIADYIGEHREVSDALNEAIGKKADREPATVEKDGLMSREDKGKLNGIDTGANCYVHPETHPAGMVECDPGHRFVTDGEKAKWDGAPTIGFGTAYPDSMPGNSLFFLVKS